jgi:hypothetical protein
MDMAIREFGDASLVGMFTLLAADAVFWFLFAWPFIGFFKDGWGLPNRTQTAVFAVLALAVGLLVEDLSYKFADDGRFPEVRAISILSREVGWAYTFLHHGGADSPTSQDDPGWKPAVLVTRRDLRLEVLMGSKEPDPAADPKDVDRVAQEPLDGTICDPQEEQKQKAAFAADDRKETDPDPHPDRYELTPTSFGREVGALDLLDKSGMPVRGVNTKALREWLDRGEARTITRACRGLLAVAVEELYYQAKNVSFRQPTYFDEMSRIETRFDFARSIFVTAWAFVVFSEAMLVGAWCRWLVGLASTWLRRTKTSRGRETAEWLSRGAGVVGTAAVIIAIHRFKEARVVLFLASAIALALIAWGLQRSVAPRVPAASKKQDASHANSKPSEQAAAAGLPAAGLMVLVLFGFFAVGALAYNFEQNEFDKRAYGYFESVNVGPGVTAGHAGQ